MRNVIGAGPSSKPDTSASVGLHASPWMMPNDSDDCVTLGNMAQNNTTNHWQAGGTSLCP